MPVMIPAALNRDAPASERRVFELLQQLPGADRWHVLHSLGLSNSYSGEYGEIDFVVIIPGVGVVCIEVKGGGVSCSNGVWTSVDQHGARHSLRRSPFAQAKDSMWKLVSAMRRHFGANSVEADCAIGWIVVFPDVASPPPTPEFARAEVIDMNDLRGDLAACLTNAPSLVAAYAHRRKPSPATCERILRFLRPSFERVCTVSSSLWDTEQRIRSLTEEQYVILDAIAENPLCLVHGPAGTGKTLLAVEAARRAIASGQTVMLTCFNRRLGRWLSSVIERGNESGSIIAGNLHKLLRERILRSSLVDEFLRAEAAPSPRFFSDDYYEFGALAIAEIGEQFDVVIVDEAQDLPMKGLQPVVDQWTAMKPGRRVLLFGDFARQAIYDASTRRRDEVAERFPGMASFALSLNCRNTRLIAKQIDLVAGDCGSKVSDRQPEGHAVEYISHSNDGELVDNLDRVMSNLRTQGYKAGEIVVLAPSRFENGSLAHVTTLAGWHLRDFDTAGPGEIGRSTIHTFKGLESPVVILANIDTRDADEADNLLYVGMSRARTRLFVLCSKATQQLIDARIVNNLEISAARQ
jgi:hypothetical protein